MNDAPALSSADVGVALAGHGGGITAEAADVINDLRAAAPFESGTQKTPYARRMLSLASRVLLPEYLRSSPAPPMDKSPPGL